jgi:hypothetical protein
MPLCQHGQLRLIIVLRRAGLGGLVREYAELA